MSSDMVTAISASSPNVLFYVIYRVGWWAVLLFTHIITQPPLAPHCVTLFYSLSTSNPIFPKASSQVSKTMSRTQHMDNIFLHLTSSPPWPPTQGRHPMVTELKGSQPLGIQSILRNILLSYIEIREISSLKNKCLAFLQSRRDWIHILETSSTSVLKRNILEINKYTQLLGILRKPCFQKRAWKNINPEF